MSKNDAKIVTNKFGDKYIDIINKTHFSNLPAKEIISAIFLQKLNNRGMFYIIIGTDSGLFPLYLDLLPKPEKTNFLFIELDLIYPIIKELSTNLHFENIFITTPENWEDTAKELDIAHYMLNDHVSIISSLAATEGHIEDYQDVYSHVKEKVYSLYYEIISQTFSTPFVRESLLNAYYNISPAIKLKNTCKGDAIVLAAGPSLQEHLPWIRNNQEHITIITVSRLCNYLSLNSIKPDIVVSVDPHPLNYEQSKGLEKFDSGTLFVHAYHTNHKLVKSFNNASFYLGQRLPWDSKLNEQNLPTYGPTVTNASIALAINMGFENIYLAGVDLCFMNSGETHIDGQTKNRYKEAEVKTYAGKTAPTIQDFVLGIKSLSNQVKILNGKVFNLSLNAAECEGINYSEYPNEINTKFDFHDLEKKQSKLSTQEKEKIKNEIFTAKKKLIFIKNQCTKALQLNDLWIKKSNDDEIENIKFKIDLIEKKLNTKKYKTFFILAKSLAGQDYQRLHNESSENITKDHEHYWLSKYYSVVQDAIANNIALFENALDEINKEFKRK